MKKVIDCTLDFIEYLFYEFEWNGNEGRFYKRFYYNKNSILKAVYIVSCETNEIIKKFDLDDCNTANEYLDLLVNFKKELTELSDMELE